MFNASDMPEWAKHVMGLSIGLSYLIGIFVTGFAFFARSDEMDNQKEDLENPSQAPKSELYRSRPELRMYRVQRKFGQIGKYVDHMGFVHYLPKPPVSFDSYQSSLGA